MLVTVYPAKLKGVQMAPASKSSMQRACAAALLHVGETVIHNPGHSNDDLAALDVIQKLGAEVAINTNAITIHSKGVFGGGKKHDSKQNINKSTTWSPSSSCSRREAADW